MLILKKITKYVLESGATDLGEDLEIYRVFLGTISGIIRGKFLVSIRKGGKSFSPFWHFAMQRR